MGYAPNVSVFYAIGILLFITGMLCIYYAKPEIIEKKQPILREEVKLTRYCVHCGAPIPPGSEFCLVCGRKIS